MYINTETGQYPLSVAQIQELHPMTMMAQHLECYAPVEPTDTPTYDADTSKPADDGNWTGGRQGRGELKGTKYGISAASYPHLDIKALTLEQAKAIYLEDFWDVIGRAHPAIKFQMFDAAVNHGRGNAVRILQRAVMVADDGIWGPRSQAALDSMQELRGHNDVLLRFLGFRLKFWASLAKFDQFGRGWTNRGAENLLFAAEDN